jgi:hypothetical protein
MLRLILIDKTKRPTCGRRIGGNVELIPGGIVESAAMGREGIDFAEHGDEDKSWGFGGGGVRGWKRYSCPLLG